MSKGGVLAFLLAAPVALVTCAEQPGR